MGNRRHRRRFLPQVGVTADFRLNEFGHVEPVKYVQGFVDGLAIFRMSLLAHPFRVRAPGY